MTPSLILGLVGEIKTAGMPQHVGMNRKREPCDLSGPQYNVPYRPCGQWVQAGIVFPANISEMNRIRVVYEMNLDSTGARRLALGHHITVLHP